MFDRNNKLDIVTIDKKIIFTNALKILCDEIPGCNCGICSKDSELLNSNLLVVELTFSCLEIKTNKVKYSLYIDFFYDYKQSTIYNNPDLFFPFSLSIENDFFDNAIINWRINENLEQNDFNAFIKSEQIKKLNIDFDLVMELAQFEIQKIVQSLLNSLRS